MLTFLKNVLTFLKNVLVFLKNDPTFLKNSLTFLKNSLSFLKSMQRLSSRHTRYAHFFSFGWFLFINAAIFYVSPYSLLFLAIIYFSICLWMAVDVQSYKPYSMFCLFQSIQYLLLLCNFPFCDIHRRFNQSQMGVGLWKITK